MLDPHKYHNSCHFRCHTALLVLPEIEWSVREDFGEISIIQISISNQLAIAILIVHICNIIMSSRYDDLLYPVATSSKADAERLQQIHPVIKQSMGNRLIFAPIDFTKGNRKKILDCCTSDGFWMFDLRNDIGSKHGHQFVGIDIDKTRFPLKSPKDVTFHVQDVNDPWPESWKGSFDLVHQRFGLAGAGSRSQAVVNSLLELVKSGGWAQFVEAEYITADDDGPAVHQVMALLHEIFARMGVPTDYIRRASGWLKEAGFVNVDDELAPTCLGAKVPDPALREQSVGSSCVAAEGLVTHAKGEKLQLMLRSQH